MEQFVGKVRLFGADIVASVLSGPSASLSTVATRPETVPAIDLTPAVAEPAARSAATAQYATWCDAISA